MLRFSLGTFSVTRLSQGLVRVGESSVANAALSSIILKHVFSAVFLVILPLVVQRRPKCRLHVDKERLARNALVGVHLRPSIVPKVRAVRTSGTTSCVTSTVVFPCGSVVPCCRLSLSPFLRRSKKFPKSPCLAPSVDLS